MKFKLTDILILAGVGAGAFIAYKLFTGELQIPGLTPNTDTIQNVDDNPVGVVGEGGTADSDAYNGRITLSS